MSPASSRPMAGLRPMRWSWPSAASRRSLFARTASEGNVFGTFGRDLLIWTRRLAGGPSPSMSQSYPQHAQCFRCNSVCGKCKFRRRCSAIRQAQTGNAHRSLPLLRLSARRDHLCRFLKAGIAGDQAGSLSYAETGNWNCSATSRFTWSADLWSARVPSLHLAADRKAGKRFSHSKPMHLERL
jgi:hypothetical protein